jgi:hypothetical protein
LKNAAELGVTRSPAAPNLNGHILLEGINMQTPMGSIVVAIPMRATGFLVVARRVLSDIPVSFHLTYDEACTAAKDFASDPCRDDRFTWEYDVTLWLDIYAFADGRCVGIRGPAIDVPQKRLARTAAAERV